MTGPPELMSAPQWLAGLRADLGLDDDGHLAAALVTRGTAVGAFVRSRPLTTTRKSSVSDVVTEADHQAEADIVAALREFRPGDGILGEEGAADESTTGRSWIIDPIDGTYNFASRIGNWCSAIARLEPAGALLGAVRSGSSGESWLGRVDADGAGELRLDGRLVPPLIEVPLADVAMTTYAHPTRMGDPDLIEPWLAAAGGAATVRMLGSGSLDLAAVATGRAGAFLQSGTADWDWYPGLALVRAAGGVGEVVHHRGHRWHIAGTAGVVSQVIERLTSA